MRCMETKSDSREGNHMIPFLVGLGLVIGGTLLVKYWKNIVDWLKDFIPKLKMAWKRVRPMLPWIEQTTTRKVEESEVPAHIRDRLKNEETNITHEMEEELELTV